MFKVIPTLVTSSHSMSLPEETNTCGMTAKLVGHTTQMCIRIMQTAIRAVTETLPMTTAQINQYYNQVHSWLLFWFFNRPVFFCGGEKGWQQNQLLTSKKLKHSAKYQERKCFKKIYFFIQSYFKCLFPQLN